MKKKTIAKAKAMNKKDSIKANQTIVLPNKVDCSSGFLATAKLYEANNIPAPKAAKPIGNILKPINNNLNAETNITERL